MTAKLRLLAVLVVAAVAVGLHWPPARTEFTLDARSFVEENASLRGIDTAAGALLRSFPPAENGRALYRPLTNTSHAVEWAWFGAESRGYYAVNALLYGIVVLLLLALLHRFSIGPEAAFGAALLFAVHPVHSEAVDAIAGRSELLSLGLSLGSLLAFDRALFSPADRSARPTLAGPPALLALLLFAAAALSKETGTVTGALLALQLLMAHRSEPGRVPLRRAALDLAPYALIALALLVLRFAVLGRFIPLQTGVHLITKYFFEIRMFGQLPVGTYKRMSHFVDCRPAASPGNT